jgi:CheY-like chemotaxis protein
MSAADIAGGGSAHMQVAPTPLRILVAEDESLAAMVIEEALTDLGHDVTLAQDGQAALEMAENASFDMLITDLAMPRLPGWELIPRLRAGRPGLPVVVMTGFLPPGLGTTLFGMPGGPMALLLKPFDLSALIAAIDRLVAAGTAKAA